jgi:hypothetical protein
MAVAMRGWGWRGAKGKDTVACGASPTVPGRGCGPRVGPRGHTYERHHVVWAIQTEGGGVRGVGTSASGSREEGDRPDPADEGCGGTGGEGREGREVEGLQDGAVHERIQVRPRRLHGGLGRRGED